jgi:predicted enzyme related to lactoylglutathione lyase
MLTNSEVMTVLPIMDMKRAKDFYQSKLQLIPEGEHGDGSFVFKCGHSKISLMPKPEGTKSDYTALSFEVKNIEDEISQLESRGVKFEDYDYPDLKTTQHIATMGDERSAWFKDTEGNILCIHQELPH